jgi:hypothetical protein
MADCNTLITLQLATPAGFACVQAAVTEYHSLRAQYRAAGFELASTDVIEQLIGMA